MKAQINTVAVPANKPAMRTSKMFKSRTVMIVDDCDAMRIMLDLLAQSWGLETITAENGVHAQVLLSYKVPDLIISDLNMPIVNGINLLCWIKTKKYLSDVRILMISSDDLCLWEAAALESGADECLSKSTKPDDLREHVFGLFQRGLKCHAA